MFAAEVFNRNTRKTRSAVTNDLFRVPGLDMRSPQGRRYRDIMGSLLAEFGAADGLRLRELATIRATLEMAQAAALAGDAAAADQVVRISNLIGRKERELRTRKAAAAAAMPRKPLRERILSAQASRRAACESSVDGPSPSVGGAVTNERGERSPTLREYVATRLQTSDGEA